MEEEKNMEKHKKKTEACAPTGIAAANIEIEKTDVGVTRKS